MSIKNNFDDIMEAARKMQKNLEEAQEQLGLKEVTGKAEGGLAQVVMNGHHFPTQVYLDNSLGNPDTLRRIEKLVLHAIQDAAQKVDKASQETIVDVTKDIGLPALEES